MVLEAIIEGILWIVGGVYGLGLFVGSLFACVAFLLGPLLGYSAWVVLIAFVVGFVIGMIWASKTNTDPVTPYDLAD